MAKIKTRHHLIPKSRKDTYKVKKQVPTSVTLKLWEDKHKAWHTLFANCTLDEIIITLNRVRRIKYGNTLNYAHM